jgi:hypothetical protein
MERELIEWSKEDWISRSKYAGINYDAGKAQLFFAKLDEY